jgi:hypothetical protein
MVQPVCSLPLTRTPVFDPCPVNNGFMVDQVVVGQVSFRVIRVFPLSINPQMFQTHPHVQSYFWLERQMNEAHRPTKKRDTVS